MPMVAMVCLSQTVAGGHRHCFHNCEQEEERGEGRKPKTECRVLILGGSWTNSAEMCFCMDTATIVQ